MLSKKGMGPALIVTLVIAILVLLWSTGILGWAATALMNAIKECNGECKESCKSTELKPFFFKSCYKDGKEVEGMVCCLGGKNTGGNGTNKDPTARIEVRYGSGQNKVTGSSTVSMNIGKHNELMYWAAGKDAKDCRVRILLDGNLAPGGEAREPCVPSDINARPPDVSGHRDIIPGIGQKGKAYSVEITLMDINDKEIISDTIKFEPAACPWVCSGILNQFCGIPELKTTCNLDCAWNNGICEAKATT